jgi:hypothetical protein
MDARIAEDKEVAKETVLGMVTRIGTRENVPNAEEEKLTLAKLEAAAAKEEDPKAAMDLKDHAAAQAAAKAAAQAAAEASEEEMAAELKAKSEVEAAAGLMAAHKSADEERLRKKVEEEALAKAKTDAAAEAKVVEKPKVAEEKVATVKVKVESNKPAKIHMEPSGEGLIGEVFAYRVFKKNPQWCVEWTADKAVSWETFDKLDSAPLREKALELQKSVA